MFQDMWIWAEHEDDVWKPARIIEVTQKLITVSFVCGKTVSIQNRVNVTMFC